MNPLDSHEVRKKINEIISGKRLFCFKVKANNKIFLFKMPSCTDKLKADLVYDELYFKALNDGIPSKVEIFKMIEEKGIISKDEIKKYHSYQAKIKTCKLMASRTRSEKQRKQINKDIRLYETISAEITAKHREYELNSAESKAEQSKTLYLVRNGIFNLDESLYWKDEGSFINETNASLQNNLIREYLNFAKGFDVDAIRFLARHQEWRIYWKSCTETGSQLFEGPTTTWDINKLLISYWSSFYDSIYKHHNCPDDEIINDDYKCDQWIEDQLRQVSSTNNNGPISTDSSKKGVVTTKLNVAEPYRVVTSSSLE